MNQGCPNLVFFTSNQVRKSKITLMKTKVFYIKKKKKNTLLPENLLILIITST